MTRIRGTHFVVVALALAAANVIAQACLPRPRTRAFRRAARVYRQVLLRKDRSRRLGGHCHASFTPRQNRSLQRARLRRRGEAHQDGEGHDFRQYSMTKAIASTALMTLYEEGASDRRPISKYFLSSPICGAAHSRRAARRDSCARTSAHHSRHHAAYGGFHARLSNDKFDEQYAKADLFSVDLTLDEMMKRLAKIPLRYSRERSGLTAWGRTCSAAGGSALRVPFDEYCRSTSSTSGNERHGLLVGAGQGDRLATVHWMKDGKLTRSTRLMGIPKAIWLFTSLVGEQLYRESQAQGGSYGLVATAEITGALRR